MLAGIEAGRLDGLIVWHPDRLHRSPIELEEFIQLVEATGVAVGTVTAGQYDLSTPTGRLGARIVGAVARHESEHKSERIRRKHLELAQNGQVPGGGRRPFGYENDRVTLRAEEASLVREAADRVLSGEGVRTVAADWQRRGVSSVTGAQWSATTLKRLLMSGRIAGWREHHGEFVARAEWPAIISKDESDRLRRLLMDPSRNRSTGNVRSYLLSGLVRCGRCGARMTAAPVMRKGHRYRRYACLTDRGGCNRCGIGAQPLEDVVIEAVMQRLDGPALDRVVAEADAKPQGSEVAEIEARMADLADAFAAGEIGRKEWARARDGLARRLEIAQAVEAVEVRATMAASLLVGEGALRDRWPAIGPDRQRLILEAVIKEIVIAPTSKAGNKFDPGRIEVVWLA